MAGTAVQVGSGFIRVTAKTLPEDYADFKRRWQQGLEQALGSLNLTTPLIDPQVLAQQGQDAGQALGQQLVQAAQQQVQTGANSVTQSIAQQASQQGQDAGQQLGQQLTQAAQSHIQTNATQITQSIGQSAASLGQQAGTQLGQSLTSSAQNSVQSNAASVTAPIAAGGNNTGAKLGLAVAAGFIASKAGQLINKGLQQAMEVESGSKKLQASLGLSPEDAARLGETAGNLYKEAYGDSLEEINGAMGSVISSIDGMRGASSEAIGDMTKKALILSKVMEVDVARSTQVVGQMVKTGLVKDANEGFDLIGKGMQDLPMNVREGLLDAMDEYSQFFATMGIGGEEAVQILTQAGSKLGEFGLDKVGDSIKEFGIRSADGSKASLEAFKAIGLSGKEMTNAFVAGGPEAGVAFDKVVAGLLAIKDPAKRAANSIALFGTPLEDLNTAEIENILKSFQGTTDAVGEATGAMDEMGKVMGDDMATQAQKAKNSLNMALGEIALPLMKAILPVVQDLAKWIAENNDLIVAWGGPLLTIGLVIGGIVSVVSAFSAVAGVLIPVIRAITAAQWTWNAALLANPITLWVLAIAALLAIIAVLVLNWDSVVEGFQNSINWIVELFQGLGKVISDLFNPLGGFFEQLFGGGNFSVTGALSGGMPMMAKGGMVPFRQGGTPVILSEKQNEIVMNESSYNEFADSTSTLINNINKGGGGGGGMTQNNYFAHVDARHAEKLLVNQYKKQNGF